MCTYLKHGGPDDEGFYTDETANLVLGNRRLSLVDLSKAGHQPMHYKNRYSITYNGEIYNFRELRKELEQLGHTFVSHTDTEVILAAFDQWETHAFQRFNGMFAFALWDNEDKYLYLVRDAVGMKPLYYSNASGGIAFASETRALQKIPFLKKENPNWPVYLLAYGHIPEPVTTLDSVVPLRKGCFLKYHANTGISTLQCFKHYSFDETTGAGQKNDCIKTLMKESVNRHFAADASIGVFLSGGLDSSIIASLAASLKKSHIQTLSLYFDEAAFSEKKYQDLVLKQIDSSSFQHLLRQTEFQESFPQIINNMDMPCSDGINTWFISKYANIKGLKAVLSGLGADELFGGYPSFSRIRFSRFIQQFPSAFHSIRKKSTRKQLNRLSYLGMDGIKGVYLFLRGHFSPYEIARQLGMHESDVWNILDDLPVMTHVSGLSYKNQASWMEFNLYMQNQLLRDADVMGMAHGVEIRVPFLDDEVIRFAFSMNDEEKYVGPLRKQFLINSFTELLPREIWNRPKMGFSFPFAQWLNQSSFVSGMMKESQKMTRLNYEKFVKGDLHWSHLMSLILLKEKGLV